MTAPALVAALLAASCGRSPTTRHMILISVDTLRPDHLGCYGYDRETSPRLDRLAREGAFFRAAVSTGSWTLPAHMSMLTGLLPVVHGVQKRHKALDPARPLIQEILRDAGFRTAGFVSGAFVDERYGFARGFETYTNFWESEEDLFDGVPPDTDLEGFLARLIKRTAPPRGPEPAPMSSARRRPGSRTTRTSPSSCSSISGSRTTTTSRRHRSTPDSFPRDTGAPSA